MRRNKEKPSAWELRAGELKTVTPKPREWGQRLFTDLENNAVFRLMLYRARIGNQSTSVYPNIKRIISMILAGFICIMVMKIPVNGSNWDFFRLIIFSVAVLTICAGIFRIARDWPQTPFPHSQLSWGNLQGSFLRDLHATPADARSYVIALWAYLHLFSDSRNPLPMGLEFLLYPILGYNLDIDSSPMYGAIVILPLITLFNSHQQFNANHHILQVLEKAEDYDQRCRKIKTKRVRPNHVRDRWLIVGTFPPLLLLIFINTLYVQHYLGITITKAILFVFCGAFAITSSCLSIRERRKRLPQYFHMAILYIRRSLSCTEPDTQRSQ